MGYCNSDVAKEIKQSGFYYLKNPVLASITFLASLEGLCITISEFYYSKFNEEIDLIKWLYVLQYANVLGTGKTINKELD